MAHAIDVAFQLLVGVDRHHLDETVVVLNTVKGMVSTVFCMLSGMNQMIQHCTLQCLTTIQMLLQSLLTGLKHISYYLSQTHGRTNICLQR